MAEARIPLIPQNHADFHSRRASLDPNSPVPPQLSDSRLLQLTPRICTMKRGPRFKEYSDLRDRKLRLKFLKEERTLEVDGKVQNRSVLTPTKKQVKFSPNFATPKTRSKIPSALAQSVPDFSSALRKENRRLVAPPVTPRVYGKVLGGSKSVYSAEKRGGSTARKSYANVDRF